ncbi:MFS transporter [Tunturiibacter lichenicola]|jgi:MFS transporter, SHS family, lactate transporter|uniref:MFS transporter n=1 Tax=Tunturiibacter lichenicola TaxID=2051959 RepID=UPI003D9BBE1C
MSKKQTSPVSGAAPLQPAEATSYRAPVIAGFSGWLLDAFDFFLVTFCLTAMAKEFHKTDAQIALVITMTLLFRPVGGFVFGLMADRYGRRLPLMINIGFFAFAEILTGLAPNYTVLLIVRALFGVVMGGNWGVGTSLAMEGAPVGKRGMLSGLLQEGYAAGNVLAAVSYFFLYGRIGWRPLFFLGSLPAILLVLFIRFRVEESKVWQKTRTTSWAEQGREIISYWKLFLYLVAFMTMMLFASHGTQDMYPTFLQRGWHFTPAHRAVVTGISGIGAILGGIIFGHFSDRLGRRRTIITAFILGILIVPLWAYAPNQGLLITGAFLMQFMVQGAWGVIPAHLAELSPDSVRGLLPGFAYQTAGIFASTVVYIEAAYAQKTSYASAMALTAASVFILASVMAAVGRERRGHTFGA